MIIYNSLSYIIVFQWTFVLLNAWSFQNVCDCGQRSPSSLSLTSWCDYRKSNFLARKTGRVPRDNKSDLVLKLIDIMMQEHSLSLSVVAPWPFRFSCTPLQIYSTVYQGRVMGKAIVWKKRVNSWSQTLCSGFIIVTFRMTWLERSIELERWHK